MKVLIHLIDEKHYAWLILLYHEVFLDLKGRSWFSVTDLEKHVTLVDLKEKSRKALRFDWDKPVFYDSFTKTLYTLCVLTFPQ